MAAGSVLAVRTFSNIRAMITEAKWAKSVEEVKHGGMIDNQVGATKLLESGVELQEGPAEARTGSDNQMDVRNETVEEDSASRERKHRIELPLNSDGNNASEKKSAQHSNSHWVSVKPHQWLKSRLIKAKL